MLPQNLVVAPLEAEFRRPIRPKQCPVNAGGARILVPSLQPDLKYLLAEPIVAWQELDALELACILECHSLA